MVHRLWLAPRNHLRNLAKVLKRRSQVLRSHLKNQVLRNRHLLNLLAQVQKFQNHHLQVAHLVFQAAQAFQVVLAQAVAQFMLHQVVQVLQVALCMLQAHHLQAAHQAHLRLAHTQLMPVTTCIESLLTTA